MASTGSELSFRASELVLTVNITRTVRTKVNSHDGGSDSSTRRGDEMVA